MSDEPKSDVQRAADQVQAGEQALDLLERFYEHAALIRAVVPSTPVPVLDKLEAEVAAILRLAGRKVE